MQVIQDELAELIDRAHLAYWDALAKHDPHTAAQRGLMYFSLLAAWDVFGFGFYPVRGAP